MMIRRNPPRALVLSLIVVLLLVLALQILWGYYLAPRLTIRRIVLEDDLGLSDIQVMEMLDLEGETWASLDENTLSARLEAYPVVRRARVVKVFPDTLKLFVYKRRPLAVAFFEDEGATIPAVFDEEGFVVQVGGAVESLPILSGVGFPPAAVGARIDPELAGIFSDLTRLRGEDASLFNLVSELELVETGGSDFDLRLYMNHVKIPILVDRDLSAESVRRAILVLDVLSTDSVGAVDEADMRGGHVVFRRGEEG